jgi:hypothetical protein
MTSEQIDILEKDITLQPDHYPYRHCILELIKRVRFLEARNTELQTTGTTLIYENRKLVSANEVLDRVIKTLSTYIE